MSVTSRPESKGNGSRGMSFKANSANYTTDEPVEEAKQKASPETMLPDEPMFSMDINKGCRKAHNETQTKAKTTTETP